MSVSTLYLENRDALILAVYRIVSCQQTAEDITQEAYLRLMQAIHSQSVDNPKSYLFQIGRNLALDHLRKQRVREPVKDNKNSDGTEADVDFLVSQLLSPDQQVAVQQELDDMLAALGEMTERRREILVLHKFHHWDYTRIAKHFGISESAIEKNMHKAMTHLLASRSNK
ncbi:MAG: RNA polymerase sigma factor [Methylococcaceae bacterium]|nr:RNA polymerase sigma factor [Methylococcaceae bacterium]